VGVIVVGLGVAGLEISRVRTQIHSLEATSELLDTVLEIRRYEKNWLLYHEVTDFEKNSDMVNSAFTLLQERRDDIVEMNPLITVNRINEVLTVYSDLMRREFQQFTVGGQDTLILWQVREHGQLMVTIAEQMNIAVRSTIDKTLEFITLTGLVCSIWVIFFAVVLGKQLASSAVRPLQHIVDCTRKISAGEPYSFEVSKTEEIRAVIQAFNVMLAKLEQREKQVIRSEKLAAVGTLMAGVAHELNNPLSNAGVSAQILLEEMKEPE